MNSKIYVKYKYHGADVYFVMQISHTTTLAFVALYVLLYVYYKTEWY